MEIILYMCMLVYTYCDYNWFDLYSIVICFSLEINDYKTHNYDFISVSSRLIVYIYTYTRLY